jgi:hypothetical protein
VRERLFVLDSVKSSTVSERSSWRSESKDPAEADTLVVEDAVLVVLTGGK